MYNMNVSSESLLVGILLVGETQKSRGQVVGVARLPSAAKLQTLQQLRTTLAPFLPSEFGKKNYLFTTPRGWKISVRLEESLLAAEVMDQDMCMRVQVDYAKPRIGIVVERDDPHTNAPLGFVLCELNKGLCDFARQVIQELLPSHPLLTPAPFSFLDRNGWPIAPDQQTHFTVMDVIGDNVVRIRYHAGYRDSPHLVTGIPPLLALPQPTRPATPPEAGTELARQASAPALVPHPAGTETKGAADLLARSACTGAGRDNRCNARGEILISYVHSEATPHASALRRALQLDGYSVFLDVESIKGGADWQDALNEAISTCSLFVPLVTQRYGYTLWTNREVKLADILGKAILPVSFISNWPPPCLAIQFSTTQYVQWKERRHDNAADDADGGAKGAPGSLCTETVAAVAKAIAQGYQREVAKLSQPTTALDPTPGSGDKDATDTPTSTSTFPQVVTRSSVKSCPSLLPSCVPHDLQETLQQPRSGTPLVAIVCHPAQKDMATSIADTLGREGWEVWCSCNAPAVVVPTQGQGLGEETPLRINEAGVVVVMFSQEFVECERCQAQVFYSEQRKRVVPLFVGSVQLPDWAAMLVGTSNFVDSRSSGYLGTLLERVRVTLDPEAQCLELAMAARQKAELDSLCIDLAGKLPKGRLVYISGGTKFFSPLGEAICVELGMQLAGERDVTLVTGGFYGVGEAVGRSFSKERARTGGPEGVCHIVAMRDDHDRSVQTRQRADGTFEAVPYGNTLFYGSSVRQREMLTPRLLDICVLVEGGPGAAFEVQQFSWNEKCVIPVPVTGGAASGLFEVPKSIFQRPWCVSESDWSLLGDHSAKPRVVAAAIVRVIRALGLEGKEKAVALMRADTQIVQDGGHSPS